MDDYVWAALDYAESRRRREVSVRLAEWVQDDVWPEDFYCKLGTRKID
jgi:hypothetical protein